MSRLLKLLLVRGFLVPNNLIFESDAISVPTFVSELCQILILIYKWMGFLVPHNLVFEADAISQRIHSYSHLLEAKLLILC